MYFIHFYYYFDSQIIEYFVEKFFSEGHISVSENFDILLIIMQKIVERIQSNKPLNNQAQIFSSIINKCLELFVKELLDLIHEDKIFYLLNFVLRVFNTAEFPVDDLFKFISDSRVLKKL